MTSKFAPNKPKFSHKSALGIAASVLVTAISTVIGKFMVGHFDVLNIAMIYLLGIVLVASRFGRIPSVVASILGVAAFDFLFTHPYFSFTVTDTQYLITFSVMLITGLLISTLATQVKEHAATVDKVSLEVESERLRSALLSSVSHDLRTPLATIIGASTSIVQGSGKLSPADVRELATVINEESDRMNRLISNLLQMTRFESGAVEVNREWHSLEEIIGSALARMERQAAERKINIHLQEDLPLVSVDGLLMEQVFINLIDNALKYSTSGSQIDIDCRQDDTGLFIQVSDRGSGLKPEETEKIFGKFYRATKTPTGAGLGLAICKAIISAHGGTIKAENRDGGGSQFSINIPAPDTEAPRITDDLESAV